MMETKMEAARFTVNLGTPVVPFFSFLFWGLGFRVYG